MNDLEQLKFTLSTKQKQVEEMLQTFTLKKEIMALLTEIEVLKQEIANMED
jgi:hypothetical protein